MSEDEEGPCTDCWDTGITIQTERRCSCQPRVEATNPTDPTAMEIARQVQSIMATGWVQPNGREECGGRLIQSYGDQREAAARADEREAVVAWLEEQREKNGAEGWNISLLALGILRCEHMKGSGDEQG